MTKTNENTVRLKKVRGQLKYGGDSIVWRVFVAGQTVGFICGSARKQDKRTGGYAVQLHFVWSAYDRNGGEVGRCNYRTRKDCLNAIVNYCQPRKIGEADEFAVNCWYTVQTNGQKAAPRVVKFLREDGDDLVFETHGKEIRGRGWSSLYEDVDDNRAVARAATFSDSSEVYANRPVSHFGGYMDEKGGK